MLSEDILPRFLQTGAGAVPRLYRDRDCERISVKDFGAKGDGSTVTSDIVRETNAVQAAMNEAMSRTANFPSQPHGLVYFPGPGCYNVADLYAAKVIGFCGDGRASSYVHLAAGVANPLFSLYAEDIAGTSLEDDYCYSFASMSIVGNRTDTTTQTSTHGILCPDTTWSISSQYSGSVHCRDFEANSFSGSALWTGVNRNAAVLNNAWMRYNNCDGWTSYGYDHYAAACSIGYNSRYGVRSLAGGNNKLIGSTLWFNGSALVINDNTNASWKVIGNDFNDNQQYGCYAKGVGGADSHLYLGNTFWNNGSQTDNTYSDILLDGIEDVVVACNHFKYGSNTNRVKYLLDYLNTDRVRWLGNAVPQTGTLPYATAICSRFSQDPGELFTLGQIMGWVANDGNLFASLYIDGTGALKFKGGAGTVTTVAPA